MSHDFLNMISICYIIYIPFHRGMTLYVNIILDFVIKSYGFLLGMHANMMWGANSVK